MSLLHTNGTAAEYSLVAEPDGHVFSGFAYPGSVVVLPSGRLLATFTGRRVHPPHRAVGAYSDDGGRTWSTVVTLLGGDQPGDSTIDLTESYADPNVVVVNDTCVMIFCVSLRYDEKIPDLSRTRFWRRISEDGGNTFGPVEEMPRHRKYYIGMVNPGLRLRNGSLVMGYSWDRSAESGSPANGEGSMDLVSGVLISRDEGRTWLPGGDCHIDTEKSPQALTHATNGLDEPAIVELPNNDLFLLGRTGTQHLWQSYSHDGGMTWEQPVPSPLVSHNCPAALLSLPDGRILAVYNNHPQLRRNLCVCVSEDGCQTWSEPQPIAPAGDNRTEIEIAYPNVCRLADGTIVVVFYQTHRKRESEHFSIFAVRLSPPQR